jgi:hypothetical protein
MYAEALAELAKARDLFGASPAREAELAHGYAVAGKTAEARKMLIALEELRKSRYVDADLIAKIYVGLGEDETAFAWLEKALAERSMKRVMLKVDPLYDRLRGNRRFGEILRRLGLGKG